MYLVFSIQQTNSQNHSKTNFPNFKFNPPASNTTNNLLNIDHIDTLNFVLKFTISFSTLEISKFSMFSKFTQLR